MNTTTQQDTQAAANKAAEEGGLPASDFQWRKKPVVIEAIQWPGCRFPETPPQWFIDAMHKTPGKPGFLMRMDDDIFIETLEGRMRAEPGDWIIRGIAGEIYPCKPEIFEASYERADRASRQVANKAEVEPVHPQFDASKGIYWFSVLLKCARLLDLPDDEPIPSGVLKAVEALVATPPATTGASTAPVNSVALNLEAQLRDVVRQRDALAAAIRDAAVKSGIASADAWLAGPHLLMLADDMASVIAALKPVGASNVLTDERITEIFDESYKSDEYSGRYKKFARAIAREVAAQAGQVAVPEVVVEALDIALDLAMAEAENVHTTYAGYKPHKHEAVDRDVETVKRAIDAVAAPSPAKESK